MSDPVINTQMLDLVMDFIKHFPEQHKQSAWVDVKYDPYLDEMCGTTCCFAGHALLMSGDYDVRVNRDCSGRITDADIINTDGEAVRDYSERAQEVLGLNEEEAEALFRFDNRIETLPVVIESIKAGEYRN